MNSYWVSTATCTWKVVFSLDPHNAPSQYSSHFILIFSWAGYTGNSHKRCLFPSASQWWGWSNQNLQMRGPVLANIPIPAHLPNSDCDPVTEISKTAQHNSVLCGAIGLYLGVGSPGNSLCVRQGVRGIDCSERWMGKTGRKERQTVKGRLVTAAGLWCLIPLGHFREPVWTEHILQNIYFLEEWGNWGIFTSTPICSCQGLLPVTSDLLCGCVQQALVATENCQSDQSAPKQKGHGDTGGV